MRITSAAGALESHEKGVPTTMLSGIVSNSHPVRRGSCRDVKILNVRATSMRGTNMSYGNQLGFCAALRPQRLAVYARAILAKQLSVNMKTEDSCPLFLTL